MKRFLFLTTHCTLLCSVVFVMACMPVPSLAQMKQIPKVFSVAQFIEMKSFRDQVLGCSIDQKGMKHVYHYNNSNWTEIATDFTNDLGQPDSIRYSRYSFITPKCFDFSGRLYICDGSAIWRIDKGQYHRIAYSDADQHNRRYTSVAVDTAGVLYSTAVVAKGDTINGIFNIKESYAQTFRFDAQGMSVLSDSRNGGGSRFVVSKFVRATERGTIWAQGGWAVDTLYELRDGKPLRSLYLPTYADLRFGSRLNTTSDITSLEEYDSSTLLMGFGSSSNLEIGGIQVYDIPSQKWTYPEASQTYRYETDSRLGIQVPPPCTSTVFDCKGRVWNVSRFVSCFESASALKPITIDSSSFFAHATLYEYDHYNSTEANTYFRDSLTKHIWNSMNGQRNTYGSGVGPECMAVTSDCKLHFFYFAVGVLEVNLDKNSSVEDAGSESKVGDSFRNSIELASILDKRCGPSIYPGLKKISLYSEIGLQLLTVESTGNFLDPTPLTEVDDFVVGVYYVKVQHETGAVILKFLKI